MSEPRDLREKDLAARRARARRTALWFGAAALLVYGGFIMLGAMAR